MPRAFKTPGLAALDRRFRRALAPAIDAADRPLAEGTAAAAPVRTGRLAGNVRLLPARVGDRKASGAVLIDDPNGVRQEYGTADQAPQPFFRPQIAAHKPAMRRTVPARLRGF